MCIRFVSFALSISLSLNGHSSPFRLRPQGSDAREHHRPSVTKFWLAPSTSDMCPTTPAPPFAGGDDLAGRPDSNTVYVTEMATRRKKFGSDDSDADANANDDDDDAEVESMSLSGSSRVLPASTTLATATGWLLLLVQQLLLPLLLPPAAVVVSYVFVIT